MTVRASLACAAVFALLAGLTIGTNPDLTVEFARSRQRERWGQRSQVFVWCWPNVALLRIVGHAEVCPCRSET